MLKQFIYGFAVLVLATATGCGGGGGNGSGDAGSPPPMDDADGDGIRDAIEGRAEDLDTDGDGTPDWQDTDSDNDGILDLHEGTADPDGDGVPNFQDTDSDNDCRPDSVEAGDDDPTTRPPDTDQDIFADPYDLDSDNDGVSDQDEDGNCNGVVDAGETDPLNADTDNDGATDLVERASGTDPNDPAANPLANGDFVFVVPHDQMPVPQHDTLDFSTNLKKLDVYFLVDRSGSMTNEISNISQIVVEVLRNLSCSSQDTGDTSGCIPDLWSGVGSIGYNNTTGEPYTHLLDIQSDPSAVAMPLSNITEVTCNNMDRPCDEATMLALWSTLTGNGTQEAAEQFQCAIDDPIVYPYPARGDCLESPAGAEGGGYPCFRPGSLPIILWATDESSDSDTIYVCPDSSVVGNTAKSMQIKLVGVASTDSKENLLTEMRDLATLTGATDITKNNQPVLIQAVDPGAGITCSDIPEPPKCVTAREVTKQHLETGLRGLANGLPLDISAVLIDDPSDPVDTVTAFIDRLETQRVEAPGCTLGLTDEDSNDDGVFDLYRGVQPRTPVCWSLVPKQNATVPALAVPQLFKATIDVYGNGVTKLDSRDVFFLIPPVIDYNIE